MTWKISEKIKDEKTKMPLSEFCKLLRGIHKLVLFYFFFFLEIIHMQQLWVWMEVGNGIIIAKNKKNNKKGKKMHFLFFQKANFWGFLFT